MSQRLRSFAVPAALTLAAVAAALFVFSWFGGAEITVGNLVIRAQNGSSAPLTAPSAGSLVAPSGFHAADLEAVRPRNVVIIIGDGMGIGAVSAASALLGRPDTGLVMETAPVVGLMHTWAADQLATDSAAAATAMATGFKTDVKVLGRTPDGQAVRNLYEAARAAGLATGIVTTSALADATPGGHLVHVESRDDYGRVLAEVLSSPTDVLIGGDWSGKPKAWRQRAYREVVDGAATMCGARGAAVVRDEEDLAAATAPFVALLPPRPDDPLAHGPALSVSAARALDILEGTGGGYLLMVESEVTDEAGHANDIVRLMAAMRELDDAVGLVLDRVAAAGETLVLVLADHETGGPHLLDGRYADGVAAVRWAHGYHSAQLVPVFAFGPGAAEFAGVFDNTRLAPRIADLLGLEPLPQLADSTRN